MLLSGKNMHLSVVSICKNVFLHIFLLIAHVVVNVEKKLKVWYNTNIPDPLYFVIGDIYHKNKRG